MRTLNQWLDLYAVSHQNPTNKLIHKVCVPVITFTVFGLLWSLPFPSTTLIYLNWATIFAAMTLVFYIRLSLSLFFIMLAQVVFYLWLCYYISSLTNLLTLSIVLFIIAWVGQFWGHKIEGKKPSFFQDLQFLLIGPIWVVKAITGFPK
jgi:uncharacterized membrane protein YGL010W